MVFTWVKLNDGFTVELESLREFYRGHRVLPWQPTFTLASIRVVYINKFVARHENLFYCKYSLEKKKTSNE